MLGRYLKWSTPQSGVAFLVDIDALLKTNQEFWRPFDHSFATTLLLLTQYASKDERIEVWGGLFQEGTETNYMVLLTGSVPPSDIINFFYGQLRQHLPEGAIIFAGSPTGLPPLLPIYAVTEGTVYRCAVTQDGAAPTLRVLLKGNEGPIIGQIPAVPVNLAAMLDKVPGVSLLVADLSSGEAGFTDDGDELSSANGEVPDLLPPIPPETLTVLPPEPIDEHTQSAESLSGSLRVVDADVVFVQEVASPQHPAEEPIIEQEVTTEAPNYEDQTTNYPSIELPTLVRQPSAQGDGAGTFIDIDDEDITSAKVVNRSALSSISDSELRLILTSAPLEETCQKLAAVLQKQPSDIARVYALASGAPAVPGPEALFALRARTVASVVGWVLAPKS